MTSELNQLSKDDDVIDDNLLDRSAHGGKIKLCCVRRIYWKAISKVFWFCRSL